MKLPPARYTIVAIAGLGEEYIVPKDPSLDDVIVMKENNRSSRALMMGTSTVTIANKKNISVSVTLYYAVSLVNISLEDIPANVKKGEFADFAFIFFPVVYKGVFRQRQEYGNYL